MPAISDDVYARLDPLFPNAGGLKRLVDLHWKNRNSARNMRVSGTDFQSNEIAELDRIFERIADSESERAALAALIVLMHVKNSAD